MKILKNTWIKSIIINALVLILVLVCLPLVYGTNDDLAISQRIAAGYPYVSFVNYFLCKALISLQPLFGTVNLYMLSQIILAYLAFVCILKLILDRLDSLLLELIAVGCIIIFSADHYCLVSFTKTAALLMLAGALLIIDTLISRRATGYFVLGFVLLYLGISYRADSYIAIVGFTGLYALLWIILNFRTLRERGYLERRQLVLYCLMAALVVGGFGLDAASDRINSSTEVLETSREYSEYRSNAVDFPTYSYYDGNKKEFNAIGLNENDMYLINNWYFDYDGAASLKSLKAIDSLKKSIDERDGKRTSLSYSLKTCVKECLHSIRVLNQTGVHIIIAALLLLLVLLLLRPRDWIFAILCCGFTLLMYLVLYYSGRATYRVFYVADIACVFWLLYHLEASEATAASVGISKLRRAALAIVALCILLMLVPVYRCCYSEYAINGSQITPAELSDYFNSDKDTLYVFATVEKTKVSYYMEPLKLPGDDSANVTGTGSWGSMTPYVLGTLADYGISNPIRDLINNDKAYFVGNRNIDRLTEYYNKWYSDKYGEIRLEKVDTVAGFGIWKVLSTK